MWGIQEHEGEGTTAGFPRKIRGVTAFSTLCYSPSNGIRSPMLYPTELRGQSLLRTLVGLLHGQTRDTWQRSSAESQVEKQYTTPRLESRGKRSLQHSTV